jgi:hypothetical protein
MIAAHIQLILLITGLATASALAVFLAPVATMKMLFGQAPSDPISLAIARHWGLLIFCFGALLVYAAYHPEVRMPTLVLASLEKIVLAIGVLTSSLRRRPTALIVALSDAAFAVLYVMYLAGL